MTGTNPQPPEPVPPVDWETLARYLAGESHAGEAEAVRRWLAADPAHTELLRGLEQPIDRLRHVPPADLDVEGALRRVHARMEAPPLQVLPTSTAAHRRLLGTRWTASLRVAAAVVLLAGGALLVRQLLRTRGEAAAPALATTTYRTGIGQRASVRLPDDTHVLLGPGSTLTLAVNFQTARSVVLAGEALFDVRHDAAHPFTVRVGEAVVQDVGTRFIVVGDGGDRVRVAVAEGAVRLGSAGRAGTGTTILLHAGDAGVLEPNGLIVAEPRTGARDELAWTQGVLVFRGAPVTEVAAALRRWYGVDLRVTDSTLARRHLTTSFAGESRERVLQVIALALGGRIELRGDTAILSP